MRRLLLVNSLVLAALLAAMLAVPAEATQQPATVPVPVDFQPEGIAIGTGDTFYVGSLRDGDIYRGDLSTGQGSVFVDVTGRAAGEVAPLMITGVVKLAPSLPIDGFWPFVHFDRKFMHLGFHIYDVGFQSPNVDAARPMVFTTTLLLLTIVVLLNLTAITLRNRLRRKYAMAAV